MSGQLCRIMLFLNSCCGTEFNSGTTSEPSHVEEQFSGSIQTETRSSRAARKSDFLETISFRTSLHSLPRPRRSRPPHWRSHDMMPECAVCVAAYGPWKKKSENREDVQLSHLIPGPEDHEYHAGIVNIASCSLAFLLRSMNCVVTCRYIANSSFLQTDPLYYPTKKK